MDQAYNEYGQTIMRKELCEVLAKAFARIDKEGPYLAIDIAYPTKTKLKDGTEASTTCVAIEPVHDAADIMLAVGALNSFSTPAGLAEELAAFMENRKENPEREMKRAEKIKANDNQPIMPPLLVFSRYVWNPVVEVPAAAKTTLKP